MIMSRRKQLHPKSMKDDEMLFILPIELKYNEKTNEIITQVNLERGHYFGPFPAILQIEDRIESFHLLDIKHNWLAYCSILNKSSENLNLIFQNNQLIVRIKESIPIGTRIYSNKIILPKLNMNKDIQIKEEPIEIEIKKSFPHGFVCNTCGIEFNNRNTLDAHRENYCIKQETRKSHSTKSTNTTGVKRKSTDNPLAIPPKRLLNESDYLIQHKLNSYEKTISLNHPIQIGQFIYVPIPIISNKPLDLSKSKKKFNQYEKEIKLYQCKFCSIRFRSLKTLQAHQDNYCIEYQKQKIHNKNLSHSFLYTCRLCKYQENNLRQMHKHLKYHLLNNESCSEDDILLKSSLIIPSNEFLFKCIICSAMFNNEKILLNHIEYVHTNTSLIECLECQSRFCSKWNLIQHMKLLHTNIKYDENVNDQKSSDSINLNIQKYSCPSCHIKFSQLHTLMQHMNNYCHSKLLINDRKKSITYCSTCEISFQHKSSYEAHKIYYCRNAEKTNIKISN